MTDNSQNNERDGFYARVRDTLSEIDEQGLTKTERLMTSAQGAEVRVRGADGADVAAIN
ncbi:MAG: hypothetical protein GW859_00695, partial [Sphingomonadales bacterium]|nr:hypothetical protein [Sphingomonadales bacterium]